MHFPPPGKAPPGGCSAAVTGGKTEERGEALVLPGVLKLSPPQVTHIKTIKREDELIEIQSDTGTWYRRWLVRCLNLSQQVRPELPGGPCAPCAPVTSHIPVTSHLPPQFWSNFQQCFVPEYRRVTLMMMAVWFTMSFRCCGVGPGWNWQRWAGTGMGWDGTRLGRDGMELGGTGPGLGALGQD